MIAKRTVKNQITLPKKIVDHFPDVEYFEVRREGDRIVLEPVRPGRAREVREKLGALGVKESDVARAVAWARKRAGDK